jgi:hypothetical protein
VEDQITAERGSGTGSAISTEKIGEEETSIAIGDETTTEITIEIEELGGVDLEVVPAIEAAEGGEAGLGLAIAGLTRKRDRQDPDLENRRKDIAARDPSKFFLEFK